MTATAIFLGYLVLWLARLVVELGLEYLNYRNVQRHRAEVPEQFARHFDRETYQKSLAYTGAKLKLGAAAFVVSGLVPLLLFARGWLGAIEAGVAGLGWGQYTTGVLFVLIVSLLLSLVQIPFDLYGTFVIEERFGFNKMTLRLWVLDFVKGLAVSGVIFVPLLYALFWFVDSTGRSWWLYGFFAVAVLQLVLVFVFPIWIAPLFNKFKPLPEGSLDRAIRELAKESGYLLSGVFVMDGSKRSTHANAYFTGFGRTKRIVLFDTLLEALKEPSVIAILAHEMGHDKLRHIQKGLALSLAMLFAGFWLVARILEYPPIFAAFGFYAPSLHAGLIILSLGFGPLFFFLSPLFNAMSRRFEYQADAYAAGRSSGRDLVEGLINLHKKSLGNLVPHHWYSFFHYSHPALAERVAAIEEKDKSYR